LVPLHTRRLDARKTFTMRLPRCATSCAALALLLVGPAAHTAEPLSQGADLVWGATLGAVIVKPDGLKIDAKQ